MRTLFLDSVRISLFIGYNTPDNRNPGYWGLVVL